LPVLAGDEKSRMVSSFSLSSWSALSATTACRAAVRPLRQACSCVVRSMPYSRSTSNFSDWGTCRIVLVRNVDEQITAFVSLL
jgi:hypothetical protein